MLLNDKLFNQRVICNYLDALIFGENIGAELLAIGSKIDTIED